MADKYTLKAVLEAVDNMSPTLKAVSQTARSTRKYLLDVGSASGKLAGSIGLPLTMLSGLLGGFSLVGMKNVMTGYTEMANSIKDGALQAGMAVDQYQRMKYVFDQNDVSAEAMAASMGKLNKNIGESAAGKNADLAGLFNHLGIKTRDANGQLRNAADILPTLADAFVRNKNPAVQARMGMALFGKSYAELLPLLNEGSAGLAKSAERYAQLKTAISGTDLDAADELNKKFKDLGVVTKSFSNTIANELVPVISPMIEDFIQWASANKKIISTNIKDAVTSLVQGIKNFDWTGFVENIKSLARGFGWLVDMVGGARNAIILFAIVMNANAIMATAGLIGALARAGIAFIGMAAQAYIAGNASLLAMLRVALMAVSIAGPIGAIGAAFTWMAGLAAGAGGIISGAMGLVTAAIRGVGVALMANPLGIILAIAGAALLIYQNWDILKKWFFEFFDWIEGKWKAFIGWIKDAAATVGGMFGGSDSTMTITQPSQTGAPSALLAASQQRVGGAIDINFNNAPPGMRVDQQNTKGPLDFNLSAGYRSDALGMP